MTKRKTAPARSQSTSRKATAAEYERYAMQPAEFIINTIFDGPELVAAGIKVHKTTVYRCLKPKSAGGTDGKIPPRLQEKLLKWARTTGRDLKPEHFFMDTPPRRR